MGCCGIVVMPARYRFRCALTRRAALAWTDVEDLPGSGDCEARLETWGSRCSWPHLRRTSWPRCSRCGGCAGTTVDPRPSRRPGVGLRSRTGTAGLGSMDYHGPAYGPEPLLHDAGLAIALVAGVVHRPRPTRHPAVPAADRTGEPHTHRHRDHRGVPGHQPRAGGVAAVGLVIAEFVYRRHLRIPGPALYAHLTALAVRGGDLR